MKYLLDTHYFLWTAFDDDKLDVDSIQAIKNPENEIFVSVITFWEISLKYSIGKLDLEGVLPNEFPEKAQMMGFDILGISAETAATFFQLPRTKHKDPFDRMLVWQAIREKATLMSRDREVRAYKKYGLKVF